jgi:hypothetical protein
VRRGFTNVASPAGGGLGVRGDGDVPGGGAAIGACAMLADVAVDPLPPPQPPRTSAIANANASDGRRTGAVARRNGAKGLDRSGHDRGLRVDAFRVRGNAPWSGGGDDAGCERR